MKKILNLKRKIKNFCFSWDEARYADLWTLVHILSAAVIGFSCSFLNLQTSSAYTIALFLVLGWEVFEYVMFLFFNVMCETIENRIVDIILGVGVFAICYHNTIEQSYENKLIFLVPTSIIAALLAFTGWLSHHEQQKLGK